MTEHSEATPSEPSVRDRLLTAHRSGGLLEGISEILRVGGLRADAVAEELALLHNDGTIDVVEAFSRLDKREDGFSFFQTRSVFERALPHIDADVITTIRTVRHLVNQAGDDLAAGFTLRSLESFLAREPARPSSALSEIQAHPELHDLVPTALLAGWQIDPETYVQEALDLTSAENPDMRRQAVFALGRIQWSDKNRPPAAAYAALERIVGQEADDKLLAVTATTAAHLLEQDPAHTELLIGLIDGAIEKGGDHATHAAARLLAEEATPDALVLRLLAHIRRVNPQHKGTVGQIDDALSRLLVRGKADVTLEALTGMLKEGVLEPDALGSVLHVLRSQKTLVSKAVTKWLLDGDPPVCRMAAMLVGDARGMDLPCEVDVAEIDMTDSRAVVFLARKVCGYFFMNPLSTTTMLISLIESALDGLIRTQIGKLILDPLLINYTGKARALIQDRMASCTAETQAVLRQVDAALEEYLNALGSISDLPELRPSDERREAYRRHQNRVMQEAYREAEKKSTFLSIVTKQTVLYGHATVSYFQDSSGSAQRQEVPLQEHVVEFEVPRMAHLDPLGLEYQLAVFRTERRAV